MMKMLHHACVIALTTMSICGTNALAQVGFREIRVPRTADGRELDVAVWYPTTATTVPTTIGENAVFTGEAVRVNAPATPGRHPLVVFSHGWSGNWANQSWLAVELVRLGYVVASVNHPGTTTRNMDSSAGAQLWERPRDISRTIDALMRDSAWSTVVSNGVAVLGHSFGGWTVVELAGGQFNPQRLEGHCKDYETLASCWTYRKLGAGANTASRAALAQNLKDPRIKAAISIDLGLGQSFEPSTLATVDIPVLIIAAGVANPQIPAELESHHVAKLLPSASTKYITIDGAKHFSFLQICKPGASAVLETPDDKVVCEDGVGANRRTIHQQTAAEVVRFLAKALPRN